MSAARGMYDYEAWASASDEYARSTPAARVVIDTDYGAILTLSPAEARKLADELTRAANDAEYGDPERTEEP